jgi:GxxExxY protein
MHENEVSSETIAAALEVHRHLGPGLVESVYEEALCHEFHLRTMPFRRQQGVPVLYKGVKLATDLRLDLIVRDLVIVDNKAKEEILPIDRVKLLTYLRLTGKRLGLLINYHSALLRDGIVRVVNGLEADPLPAPGSFKL